LGEGEGNIGAAGGEVEHGDGSVVVGDGGEEAGQVAEDDGGAAQEVIDAADVAEVRGQFGGIMAGLVQQFRQVAPGWWVGEVVGYLANGSG
jgi:hypothetical protein